MLIQWLWKFIVKQKQNMTELVKNGTRAIMLAHLSRENNEPEIAFDEVANAISGFDVGLYVADPFSPVELLIPKR